MKRRSLLAGAGLAVGSLTGCLGSIGEGTPTPPDSGLIQAGPGDYPHDIYVYNASDRDARLALTVERSGDRIYRGTHTVAADTGTVIAGVTEVSLPAGDRRLAVTVRLENGQSSTVEVEVTDCLGSVDFFIDIQGDLFGTYSIC